MLLLLALFSPFICLLVGLRNYRKSFSKYYVLVFILFYAFTITFPTGEDNMDIFRRIQQFEYMAMDTKLSFTNLLSSSYSNDNSNMSADFIERILIFFVSRFTDDYRFMTLVWSFVFGLLFVKNIWYIIEKINLKINRYNILWFSALFLIIPFWNINAFRFWIAAQIFIFGVLRFFYSDNKKYLLISLCAVFAHFSFILPLLLFLIYLFAPKNLLIANIIFVITFLMSTINIQGLDTIINYLPSGIQGKVSGYTSISYLESVAELNNVDVNFYVNFRFLSLLLGFELMFLMIYFKHKDFLENKINRNLFFLSFILLSFSNLVFEIKPLDRFFNLGAFFMFLVGLKFWIYLFDKKQFPYFYRFISFFLLTYVIVEFRIGFDTISIASILGNPITYYFISDVNFSLIDLFK